MLIALEIFLDKDVSRLSMFYKKIKHLIRIKNLCKKGNYKLLTYTQSNLYLDRRKLSDV